MGLAELEVVVRRVLRPAVGVRDHAGHDAVARRDGHAERVEHESGAHVVGHRVAEQPARAEIEHAGEVQPAFGGGDVGDVLAPRDIGLAGVEGAADEVGDREGGSSEVMKNVLAERVLRLPADVRTDTNLTWSGIAKSVQS